LFFFLRAFHRQHFMRHSARVAYLWRIPAAHTQAQVATHAITYILLISLTCVGFALRLTLLDTFPLREDEAIYGYWARTVAVDPFFLQVWPDKPPLFIWLLSGSFALLGPSEAAARLVSIFASTLTIPLVAWGARQVWGAAHAAPVAALLCALSPFAISFAPTAYTDSLLVLLGTGAIVAALRGHGMMAGLLLAAACMTKQQGVLYAPLVIALLLLPDTSRKRNRWAALGWLVVGAALLTLPVLWWDSQRWAVAPSPWALAGQTYAPLAWLPPQSWPARWGEWRALLWYLADSWTLWVLLGVVLLVAIVWAWRNWAVALLLGWALAFVALHVVSNVQMWDRYLLPLVPPLALLASGPLVRVLHLPLPAWGRGLLLLLLLMGLVELWPPALVAARGDLPIGGDHGDYAGLREAMTWVQEQEGPAILYHQALGWHFRFYLYDDLQTQGDSPPRFDLRWFPHAAYLADNAAKSPYPPKYLLVPAWAMPRDLALHMAQHGLELETRARMGQFVVLEIVQPPQPACEWCQSSWPADQWSITQWPVVPGLPVAQPNFTPLTP
jgi:4-amino-4-deoxy-L-arabinose transferase-like glycosyltransferase